MKVPNNRLVQDNLIVATAGILSEEFYDFKLEVMDKIEVVRA